MLDWTKSSVVTSTVRLFDLGNSVSYVLYNMGKCRTKPLISYTTTKYIQGPFTVTVLRLVLLCPLTTDMSQPTAARVDGNFTGQKTNLA